MSRLAIGGPRNESLVVALAFGLALVALVAALGHASGCHLNPAVTLGLTATGKGPWRYVPFHLAAQVVGAVLGSLLVWGALGGAARSEARLGAAGPAAGVGAGQIIVAGYAPLFLVYLIAPVVGDILAAVVDDRLISTATAPISVRVAARIDGVQEVE